MSIRYLSGINVDNNVLFVDDANNRVGIGTGSPSQLLHLNAASGAVYTRVQNNINSLYLGLESGGIAQVSSDVSSLKVMANTFTSFETSGSERMRITAAGNVGIGVTNPDSYNAGGNQLVIGGGAFRGLTIAGTTEGNIYFADGTNGTETYRGSIGYNHTSDYLYFYSAANERLRITSTGNVGIGTTSPEEKLHVAGSTFISYSGTNENYFGQGNALGYGRIRPFNNSGLLAFDTNYTAGGGYDFAYNGSSVVRINSSGNVGIGTTSPAAKFQVTDASSSITLQNYLNGAAIFLDGVNGDFIGGDYFHILADGSSYLGVGGYAGGATPLNVSNSGNVGIGTTSPSQKLHVNGVIEAGPVSTAGGPMIYQSYASPNYIGSIGSEYSSAAMLIGYGATGKNGASGYVSTFSNFPGIRGLIKLHSGEFSILSSISAVQTAIGGDLTMTTNFIVTNAGNVGIGTTAPTSKLHVASGRIEIDNGQSLSSRTSGGGNLFPLIQMSSNEITVGGWEGSHMSNLNLRGGNGAVLADFSQGNASFFAVRGVAGVTPNEYMRVTSTGNVGIGTTSPSYKLQVNGAMYQSGTNFTSFYDGAVRFGGTNGYTTIITNAGNVGIGTTSPSQKLTVSGSTGDILGITNGTTIGYGYVDNNGFGLFTSSGAGGTGIYYRTANIIDHYVNGSIAMRLNSTGNVGIGTTSPSEKLHVVGNGLITGTLEVDTVNNGTGDFLTRTSGGIVTRRTASEVRSDIQASQYFSVSSASWIPASTSGWFRLASTSGNQRGSVRVILSFIGGNFSPQNYIIDVTKDWSTTASLRVDVRTAQTRYITGVRVIQDTVNTSVYHLEANFASSSNPYQFDLSFDNAYGFNSTWTMATTAPLVASTNGTVILSKDIFLSGDYSTDLINTGNINISGNTLSSIDTNGNIILSPNGSGNVGIGTTSPGYKLDVNGDINTSSGVYRIGGSTILSGTVSVAVGSSGATGSVALRTTSGDGLVLNGSNVGIGTTSPLARLHTVASGTYSTSTFNGSIVVESAIPADGAYGAGIILTAGRGALANGGAAISSFYDTGDSDRAGLAFFYHNATFADPRTEGFRLTAQGNVGIGTTSPGAKLDVYASSGWNPVYTTSDTLYSGFVADSAASALDIHWVSGYPLRFSTSTAKNGTGYSEKMRITSAGNVGIGTTVPTGKLSVVGDGTEYSNIVLRHSTNQEHLIYASTNVQYNLIGSSTPTWVWGQQGSTERMRLNNTGLGIGTDSPSQKLHVTGNVRVTGAYYDSNNSAGSSGQVLTSTGTGTDWKSLAEITGVDGTGTANYVAKWSDADTITNSQIQDNGTTVGVGQAPGAAKFMVNGSVTGGGQTIYNKSYASLDTTGQAVAGLSASTNGQSAMFTFTCRGGNGEYQRIVYSCHNTSTTWNARKVVDEGTNAFDVVASASATTITFTFKARTALQQFTPAVLIEHFGGSINTSYL